ncbi:hypothetical protein [Solirhodobacter olei]|uniref:hypothetical protein n=1 Tax=Solirhodobacter olei TaxID=2493082 RepID=UPI000FD79BFF|nr:hypothetical protein [Solirhodobacter olei]
MSAESPFQADLADLMARLAAQLHETHDLGRQVEDAIGGLIHHSGQAGLRAAHSFQQLDVLVQSLDSLAIYVETLAATVPAGVGVDPREAIKQVKLRALSHALSVHRHPEEGQATPDPDDLHLF